MFDLDKIEDSFQSTAVVLANFIETAHFERHCVQNTGTKLAKNNQRVKERERTSEERFKTSEQIFIRSDIF